MGAPIVKRGMVLEVAAVARWRAPVDRAGRLPVPAESRREVPAEQAQRLRAARPGTLGPPQVVRWAVALPLVPAVFRVTAVPVEMRAALAAAQEEHPRGLRSA
jgi:hypothetical protein